MNARQHLYISAKGALFALLLLCPAESSPAMAEPSAESELADALRSKRQSRCPHRQFSNCGHGGKSLPDVTPDMSVDIRFGLNSAIVASSELPKLATVAARMAPLKSKTSQYLIVGHADAAGRSSYNQRLSEERAATVKRLLVTKYDVPDDILKTSGHGSSQLRNKARPFAAENRRVSIHIGSAQ